MEFQVEIKRTQIAKLTFSVPDGDTEAAEEQAASLVQHAKLHPEVFDGCRGRLRLRAGIHGPCWACDFRV